MPVRQNIPDGRAAEPRTRGPRSWTPVAVHLAVLALVYLLAVWTPVGQRTENALNYSDEGGAPALVYDVSGHYGAVAAIPPLNTAALPTLLAGLALVAVVAVVRKRWWAGTLAVATVLVPVGAARIGKRVLPRPDLVDAPVFHVEPSFPSGHVAIPVALTLAAVLVVPARARGPVAAAGAVWTAFTVAAVLATYQHRLSDVLGATLLACAVALAAALLLPGRSTAARMPVGRSFLVVTATLAVVAAVVGGARTDSLAESVLFAATGLLCAALTWCAARRVTGSGAVSSSA